MGLFDAVETDGLTGTHWLGIALAAATGLVHLGLGIGSLPDPLGVAALGAAGGFGLAIALVLVGVRPWWLYALGIPFTASQIVLWYVLNEPSAVGDVSALEAFDKLVQTALLVVLVVLLARVRSASRPNRGG